MRIYKRDRCYHCGGVLQLTLGLPTADWLVHYLPSTNTRAHWLLSADDSFNSQYLVNNL